MNTIHRILSRLFPKVDHEQRAENWKQAAIASTRLLWAESRFRRSEARFDRIVHLEKRLARANRKMQRQQAELKRLRPKPLKYEDPPAKCPHCVEGYVQEAGFGRCPCCNPEKQPTSPK